MRSTLLITATVLFLAVSSGAATYGRRSDTTPRPRAAVTGFGVAPTLVPPPDGPVSNGSFETNGGVNTNDFTDWTSVNYGNSTNSTWFVQTGDLGPDSGCSSNLTVPIPTDGDFAAMIGQNGPGTRILYQDVTVPNGTSSLSFDLYVDNGAGAFYTPNSLDFTVDPNEQFRMDVVNPAAAVDALGAAVLLNVYRTDVGDPLTTGGYIHVTADLSPFAGQTVRLRFAEVDNVECMTVGVDNVAITAGDASAVQVPAASTLMLALLGAALAAAAVFALKT